MRGKRMGVIALATLFLVPAVVLCLGGPSRTLAGGSPRSLQNPAYNPAPVQVNPPQENPRTRTQDQNATRNPYKPASAVSAGDVQFPFQTTADGIVVFDVSLGAGGEIRKVNVLNDVPPFTAAAEQSLRSWKFAAASFRDKPEDSEMLMAFAFRHAVYIANEPPFRPIIPVKESAETRQGFVPPGIVSVSYAGYPASTIAMGAAVVQITVKADGATGGVSVVRDLPGDFGPLAVKAAKHWKFQGARRDGQPVPSKVVVAFVFSSRALNPF